MLLILLIVPLVLAALVYAVSLLRTAVARGTIPKLEALMLGAVTNFFDTLGIGSFAPTMTWFKFRRLVPDRLIPSTMLVGHTLPALVQAVIFLILLGVRVDPVLLIGCVLAVLAGALLGAPLVGKARVWVVQAIVGLALVLAAIFYALANLGLTPAGGSAAALPLGLMIVAIVANFIFGILINFGVGNYAPTLAMLSLMGMDPRLSFPIMAGGAALAGAGASIRHISLAQVDFRIATGLAIGGVPAVLVAALIVKNMSVELLRWLVVLVVLYAASLMFREVTRRSDENGAAGYR